MLGHEGPMPTTSGMTRMLLLIKGGEASGIMGGEPMVINGNGWGNQLQWVGN